MLQPEILLSDNDMEPLALIHQEKETFSLTER